MKANLILWLITGFFLGFFSVNVLAGDTTCYGHKSETNYFVCGAHGNCTWWAAAKRPDLAAARSGSGWNAVQWYDKFKNLGFPVGRRPKAGAVAVFDATANNEAGHVAYVEVENSDGSFRVSEMDWFGSLGGDGVNYATYSPNGDGTYRRNNGSQKWTLKGFIYQKESCNPSKERCTMRTSGSIGWYPPVSSCQEATQWFKLIRDTTNQVSRIEPTTKNECPLACFKTN